MKKKTGLFEKLFPAMALKRNIAKARLDRFRSLNSTSGSRHRYQIGATSLNINSEVADNIVSIREQIRNFELKNGNISGPFRRIKKNVVGHGIRLNAEITADENGEIPRITEKQSEAANAAVEKYFDIWNRQADKRLMLQFYGSDGIQGMVEHALLRDNESIIVGRTSPRPDRIIPYCLEVLESDRLQTPPGLINDPMVENGIRFDFEGVPKSYYFLKEHPGNTISAAFKDGDYEEVPAYNDNGTKKVIFLFNPIRPEQIRAVSLLAAGLEDIQDADRYMEAEKLAALEDACMFGTVTTDDVDGWDSASNLPSGNDEYDRIHEFSPNEIKYLHPGEKLDVHRPMRPGTQFEAFIEQIWRGPANALDVPPEIFLQNWKGMNYSNARTVLLQFYATCRERQRFLIDYFCYHVYENVFRGFVAKGLVQAPSFFSRKHDWLKHSWIAPGWQWVDPAKEASGKETEVNMGIENLSDIMLSQGSDPRVKMERRAKEKRFIKDLEAKYNITMFDAAPENQKKSVQTGDKDDE